MKLKFFGYEQAYALELTQSEVVPMSPSKFSQKFERNVHKYKAHNN